MVAANYIHSDLLFPKASHLPDEKQARVGIVPVAVEQIASQKHETHPMLDSGIYQILQGGAC
jgi:hypothetical protein